MWFVVLLVCCGYAAGVLPVCCQYAAGGMLVGVLVQSWAIPLGPDTGRLWERAGLVGSAHVWVAVWRGLGLEWKMK